MEGSRVFDLEQYKKKAREAAAEGVVLLKNSEGVLPLKEGTRIALFGRSQYNYYKSGTGSGGMVNTAYVAGVMEALEKDGRFPLNEWLKNTYDAWIRDHPFDQGNGWASEPWHQEEMPITGEIAGKAAKTSDAAIILIGRTAGEDQDNRNEKGSFLLTDAEEQMLESVTSAFDRTIVLLNVGNIIDMRWIAKYNPTAVAYIWQGGQEGGNGVLDVLSGKVNPSGHLTDTIAESIEDYPSTKNFGSRVRNIQQEDIYVGYRYFETFAKDRVLYPFGYGLSYTTFDIRGEAVGKENTAGRDLDKTFVRIYVSAANTGNLPGKEVVQIYVEAPQGELGEPVRKLVDFAKTKTLAPGEKETLSFAIPAYRVAAYDDSGVTGHKSAYVLEKGTYTFYAGDNVRDAVPCGSVTQNETQVVLQLEEAMAPATAFTRMKPRKRADGTFELTWEDVPQRTVSGQEKRRKNLPPEIPQTGDQGIRLSDVLDGKKSMAAFIAQMSDEDLACIVRGEGMGSPKVTAGTAGAFGGVTEGLRKLGIPCACVSDGPSGIRMDSGNIAFSLPEGTLLACTWNTKLQEELYQWEGMELRKNHIDLLLGPGMNIHRNPLNGRNFEYFSEDPFLTGRCVAAQLRGMQKYGTNGVIKHFALNTQETARNIAETVASERAIREIYLKGFEIAVREGNASAVMTTYGPVNGFWTSSHYDLLTQILREEWGFTGIVMTDWWAKGNDEGESGDTKNEAAMIRAQNDLNMVTASAKDNTTDDNTMEALEKGMVTRAEYQRSAANICHFIMHTPAFLRFTGQETYLDRELDSEKSPEERVFFQMIQVSVPADGAPARVDVSAIGTGRGAASMISVSIRDRGMYAMRLRLRTNTERPLAQVPMSITKDGKLLKMITLTGKDKEWQTLDLPIEEPCFSNFYLKVYFAQAGMEIGEWDIYLVKSLEVEIRAAMKGLN